MRLLWILSLLALQVRVRWRWYQFRRAHFQQKDGRMKRHMLLIRHGQTQWNVDHLLPGQLPGISLNEEGRRQVERTAAALAEVPFTTIISSPLERAVETTAILKGERAATIGTDAGLADTDVGPWAGKKVEDLDKNDPDWRAYVKNPAVAPEGVETFVQVQERAVAATERYRQRQDTGEWLVFVAHADVIKLIVAHYTCIPIARVPLLHIDNASISLLSFDDEHPPVLVNLNWTPQPGWLKPQRAETTTHASAAVSEAQPAEVDR
jgi:broad specificity phosphatase PhoE